MFTIIYIYYAMTDIYWALIDVAYGGPHSVTLVHCPYSYFGLIPTQGGGLVYPRHLQIVYLKTLIWTTFKLHRLCLIGSSFCDSRILRNLLFTHSIRQEQLDCTT